MLELFKNTSSKCIILCCFVHILFWLRVITDRMLYKNNELISTLLADEHFLLLLTSTQILSFLFALHIKLAASALSVFLFILPGGRHPN